MKRMIALLLCICMVLSLAACGQPQMQSKNVSLAETSQMSRQDKELVAQLVGGVDASDMTDAALDALVDQLVGNKETTSQVVNLSTSQKTEEPSVDVTQNPGVYDENGAMTKPFDQVYPELIEKEQVKFSGESILVKLASDTLTDGLKAAGVGALEEIVPMEKSSWYEAKLTEGTDAKAALAAVRQLKEVLLAEFNYEIQTAALDDYKHFDKDKDEDFKKNGHNKDQWHFHHCGIPDGYEEMETEGGDGSVVVAVIDSGVDYTHEDLKDNMWVNAKEVPDNNRDDDGNGYVDDYYGIDLVAGKGNGGDTNGHGTHVAGIIAAKNNNVGTLGIAYSVKVMSVKAAAHNGTLNQANIAKAVLYAYENGAQVINMSFGGTACSIAVQDALATAYTRCVLVASAGNNGAPNQGLGAIPNYPACLTYVLGVMSVDEYGNLSRFSNHDAIPYNGVEYELYAPGENIMSTLPGNKYGYLSGTSMAAPIVSSFAAILRSEFSDPDMYPTKFIYGQLAATSDYYGTDGYHQIVNLEAALTKMPKPDVTYQDYRLFDDPKYSEKNNGDGVIDAGETIAIGFILHNRWGMSKNTLVTIDTKSSISGLSDPYITIHNPTVDYGSVGTYSTQDCGKIYTDELWTGWEDPFLITVSEDCPNDYRFTLNISIACENALDEEDKTVYAATARVDEAVRAGYILPAIIDKDMVLTKETLYIIPNGTLIQEGVTVRVEPGTHIQFWTDDPNDTYADKYIAYLLVNGKFLVEGTKEEPVYIYPSQLMDKYNVEIAEGSHGYVSLKYADITNFAYIYRSNTNRSNRISLAEHCTFRMAHGDLIGRQVSNGEVNHRTFPTETTYIGHINAKDCVFYKLAGFYYNGHSLRTQQLVFEDVVAERCVFVECGIKYKDGAYKDCVFLKNSYVNQMYPNATVNSSMEYAPTDFVAKLRDSKNQFSFDYCAETDATYMRYFGSTAIERDELAQMLTCIGGNYAIFETEKEYVAVVKQGIVNENSCYHMGIRYDHLKGCYTWCDGSEVGSFIDQTKTEPYSKNPYLEKNALHYIEGSTFTSFLYEIPGNWVLGLPKTINLPEYAVDMDMETTYQLLPISAPEQMDFDAFLYESTDPSVVTVSPTGLITPVSQGIADVYVYSFDKAVSNYVTVTVKEQTPLQGIAFAQGAVELPVGQSLQPALLLDPVDTTRKSVTYTSSDPAVASVDIWGRVTGMAAGKATIIAECEGITAQMEVLTYVQATTLQMSRYAILATLSDGTVELPTVITNDGAEAELSWRLTDETVAELADGKLSLKAEGTTTLVVSDSRSGLEATCLVIVGEKKASGIKSVQFYPYGNDPQYFVLMEDGRLYRWTERSGTPECVGTDIEAIDITSQERWLAVTKDGTIKRGYYTSLSELATPSAALKNEKIVKVAFDYLSNSDERYYALTATGKVYAWGCGVPGLETTGSVSTPKLVNLDGVVDVAVAQGYVWMVTDDGTLYNAYIASALKVVDTNVKKIFSTDNYRCSYLTRDGLVKTYSNGSIYTQILGLSDMDAVSYDYSSSSSSQRILAMRDGKVYAGDKNGLTEVVGISDAVGIYAANGANYVMTESGLLLGWGSNNCNQLSNRAANGEVTVPAVISMEAVEEANFALTHTNLENDVLTQNALKLTTNKQVIQAAARLYENGTEVTCNVTVTDVNVINISRNRGFEKGASYELVFEAGAIQCVRGRTNAEELRILFTFDGIKEESTERVVHKSVLDASVTRPTAVEMLINHYQAYLKGTQKNPNFTGNAILNPVSTDDVVEKWLRFQAPTVSVGTYTEVPIGGNFWGTVNQRAIELQMIDYTDFGNYARLMYAPFLTEAPENTFPFVTSVKLFNAEGEEVTTVGNEEIKFQVKFNRDMDTSIPLQVRFGSAYPYGDYEIEGRYVDARTWEGTYTLNTIIENGNQFFTIENGCSATEDLGLQLDRGRFGFVIDTTAAQALIMQGTATDTGIELKWTQDDFDTLMGYNVYRSTAEDGLYTRINKTTIPADTMSFFDSTVEPGVVYYYNFTVVKTDLTESEPSGKIVIMSKDTMAPNIYHSPAGSAFTGANLVISATVTDNLNIAYANLYYRISGQTEWKIVRMNKLNDKYSAIIPAQYMTVAGLEYYIEAFDGISYTYNASAEEPYYITVQEAIDANSLGDVDGDGVITNLDALLLLYAINDKYNPTAEEFVRADLNGDGILWAAEALQILKYVSGAVGSLKM